MRHARGDAYAGADGERALAKIDRFGNGREKCTSSLCDLRLVCPAAQDNGKFVSAEPRDEVAFAEVTDHAPRNGFQEQVTGLVVAQGVQLDIVLDGMSDLAGRVGRPITIDAETRASLAEIPPQCVALLGGDPMSLSCALFSCIQYGQSTANRPECSAIQAAYITSLRLEQPAP